MPYHIEMLPDAPVLIVNFGQDFSAADEMSNMLVELHTLINNHPEPVMIINDLRHTHWSMEDVIQSANLARQRDLSLFHHPNVRGIVGVSDSKLIQISAKGLNHDIFGGLKLPVFDTLEAAIDYVRTTIG